MFRRSLDLPVCGWCRSRFVHALERSRERDGRWRLRLRCGHCGCCRDVVVSERDVRRFDADVARGLTAIEGTVARLDRERMADQAEAFAVALRRDLIDASDFRP